MLVPHVRVMSQSKCGDVTMLSENTILGDKCEMSDRWLFLAELCGQDIKSHVRNKIIHSLLWITNFWSHVMWFAIDFHLWLSHSWKSLANHLTPGQKIFIHGNSCIILYGFMTTHGFGWRIHLRSGTCPICNMKLASVFFITSCYFFSTYHLVKFLFLLTLWEVTQWCYCLLIYIFLSRYETSLLFYSTAWFQLINPDSPQNWYGNLCIIHYVWKYYNMACHH